MTPEQFQWAPPETSDAILEPSPQGSHTQATHWQRGTLDVLDVAHRDYTPMGTQPDLGAQWTTTIAPLASPMLAYHHPALLASPTPVRVHAPISSLPMRRRDGLVGLSVGLVLLAATLSGAAALGLRGQQVPSVNAAPAPAVSAAPVDVPTGMGEVIPDPALGQDPFAATEIVPDAAGASGAPAVPGTAPKPDTTKSTKPATNQGGAVAPSRPAPATATKPAVVGTSHATAGGAASASAHTPATSPKPAATLPAPAQPQAATPAPAPTPAVQPTPRQPVSYSVSTPGGAHWKSPVAEYDAVRNGVPNATITPNY